MATCNSLAYTTNNRIRSSRTSSKRFSSVCQNYWFSQRQPNILTWTVPFHSKQCDHQNTSLVLRVGRKALAAYQVPVARVAGSAGSGVEQSLGWLLYSIHEGRLLADKSHHTLTSSPSDSADHLPAIIHSKRWCPSIFARTPTLETRNPPYSPHIPGRSMKWHSPKQAFGEPRID